MSDQQLNLRELKEQAKALGYTKIQRQKKGAPIVDLTAWNGVSAEAAGGAFTYVAVWYRLDGDQVTVNNPESRTSTMSCPKFATRLMRFP
jgi:hypothetical protein